MAEGALSGKRILGVFAHPDDETYSMAGCVKRYGQEGCASTILTFTRGEAGLIGGGSDATPETLGHVREKELREAAALAGCDDVRIVGTPDGGTVVTEEGIQAIVDLLREIRPDVLITMEPEGITRHPDHMAVSEMTTTAFERVKDEGFPRKYYLVTEPTASLGATQFLLDQRGIDWLPKDDPLFPQPSADHLVAAVVDVAEHLEMKVAALKAHLTQSDQIINWWPEDMRMMLLGAESFQRVHPPREKGEPAEYDLFAGLREA